MSGRTSLYFFLLLITSLLNAQRPGDKVISVFVDEYGCQWFGTDNGLLRKCGGVWKAYPVKPDSPGIVKDIEHQSTPSGSVLWIGTMNGILRLTYSARAITSASYYSSKTNSFLSDIINGITCDGNGAVFFATPAGIGTMVNATFLAPWSALAGDNITCVFIDSNGHQWFGTDKGLSCHTKFDAKEGWDDSFTEKLPDKYVTSVAEDKDGNIWVGTHCGLVRFGACRCTVAIWTVADGLPSSLVNDIFVDKNDSLWIATDPGAASFNGSGFSRIRTSDFAKDFLKFKRFLK